jgi:hypothetical protein
MNIPHKANLESESVKRAFITTSIALYLQACHLQHEETNSTLLSYLMAASDAGHTGTTSGNQSAGKNSCQGNAGNSGKDNDDSDGETNLGSSLVNNTGQTVSDDEFNQAENTATPRKENSAKQAEEEVATTSPGGAGDSRIIGGVNPEDDEIDWDNAVDEGTKDADAATG